MDDQAINPRASGLASITAVNQILFALVQKGVLKKDEAISLLNEGAEALEQTGESLAVSTSLNRDAADQLRMIAASFHDSL